MSSEIKLCADFQAWVRVTHPEWTPYPETGDWDLLLVHADGTQLGIQAKLRFNATLLRQALPEGGRYWTKACGPDFRGILIPKLTKDARAVCDFCGLEWFERYRDGFRTQLDADSVNRWTPWLPEQRIELPDHVPDVAAGASCPIRLTAWKEDALRICAVLEIRGHVTRADFKRFRVDHRRWVPSGWLCFDNEHGHYVRGPKLLFPKQHPEVFKQIVRSMQAEEGAT